ncbi:MAG: hypothetical protein WKF45_03945 [Ilumatobacteraceae bacterium]
MPDTLKIVEVNGIPIPARWTSTRPLHPDHGQHGTSTVAMVMFDDGEHGIEELHMAFDPPMRRSELRAVDLGSVADTEFTRRLRASVMERHADSADGTFMFDDETWTGVLSGAHRLAVNGARRSPTSSSRPWSPDHDGGVARVVDECDGPSERSVRRWLAEARARGLR